MGSAVTERAKRSDEAVPDSRLPGHRQRTLVLTYHAVHCTSDSSKKQPAADKWYAVTADQFQKQMEHLSRGGYTTSLLNEFLGQKTPRKSVILTFDDGHESNFHVVLPILQRFRLRAEFFVTVSQIAQPGFMTWQHLRLLEDAGMSVQSHGLHHRPLTELPAGMLVNELRTAKLSLEDNLNTTVKYLAIPGGFANGRVYRDALNAGYEAVCNSEPGLARSGKIIARVAVMHSTSQAAFEGLVGRKFSPLAQVIVKRKFAKVAKLFLGVQCYEALKRLRLSMTTSSGDV